MKRTLFISFSLLIVIATVLFANHLASELAEEEQRKMEIWAEATRQFILAEPGENVDFVSTIIEGNTTIPVFMTDSEGHYLFSRNVTIPSRLEKEGMEEEARAYYQAKVDHLIETTTPIEVRFDPGVLQYIYYDESLLLKQLHYFPYLQILTIFIFVLVAIISIASAHHAEQNLVWVGLCKETAHQLGTPISSLNAWNEIHRTQYADDATFQEEEQDIARLATITERFSKIGSVPTLHQAAVYPVLEQAVSYMQKRTSQRIHYTINIAEEDKALKANLNEPLFAWVIENLLRNAVDSMDGAGDITVTLRKEQRHLHIDVADTGKGIERRNHRTVFRPGYTTKSRGWGLGLSLARRIVKDYHHGRIFVLCSSPAPAQNHGTTFRITLDRI